MTRLTRRFGVAAFAGLVVWCLLTSTVLAQPGETCASATPIALGSFNGSTAGATNDGASSCGSAATAPDVWYRYTPTTDCVLVVDTCGAATNYDTVVSLHTGCPGTAENQVACNDDTCGLSALVRHGAVAGNPVYIRVSGYNGATGTFVLNVNCQQADGTDRCDQAISVGTGSYSGTTVGTFNDGTTTCGQSDTAPDVWFRYTPTEACTLRADTCGGASFDTVVSIHSGCPGSAANTLVCNDDSCALMTVVETLANAGTPYYIRVSGYNGATGTFNLNVQCIGSVQTDACENAALVQVGDFIGDTSSATIDGASMCAPNATRDVWFKYTATDDCLLRLDTCSATTFDTVVSVHRGCPGNAANEVACNDDACAFGSLVSTGIAAGTTYYIRVAPFIGVGGAFRLSVQCNASGSQGADAYVGDIRAFQQFGREGDVIGCVTDTPLCNAGTEPLPTFGNPNNVHPFFVFNMYRASEGGTRFEQIGWSWAKHMFGSAQGNECGFGCAPYQDGTHLGVGCSDTYSAGFNAIQSNMGPRTEINPWTGAFNYIGSWIQRGGAFSGSIDHRLQIRDADLNPALNQGATYFVEQYTVAPTDTNHLNSVAREPVTVAGSPGGTWSFGTTTPSINGPAIFSWAGAQFTSIPAADALTTDGRCIVGYRVTPNGNGTWHYEYAVYNHDMARGVQSFSVPVGESVVTNIGFHAPFIHGELNHDNQAWSVSRPAGQLRFSTDPVDAATPSNPILWGTLYNFRFDADRGPVTSEATIVPYLSGLPASFSGAVDAPAGGCTADWNHSGSVTSEDFFAFMADFFNGNADFNNNGLTDTQDFFDYLVAFFAGCP